MLIWRYGTTVGARATYSGVKHFLVPRLGSCCMIHLTALLAIARLLGKTKLHPCPLYPTTWFVYPAVCMVSPQCLYGSCHDRAQNQIFFHSLNYCIEVKLIIVYNFYKLLTKVCELCVQCKAEFWHQNVVSNLKKISAPL